MGAFRRLGELELAGLDDGELIEYAVTARAAGDAEAAQAALRIFAFGMEGVVLGFVRNRLSDHGDAVVEEIAERILEDSLRSIGSLTGSTAGEARAFVFKIARRRIADHLRREHPHTHPLDEDRDGGPGRIPHALRVPDPAGEVETHMFVDELLESMRPYHRRVVEHHVLMGYSARETVERLRGREPGPADDSLTEDNVHQIASRFRKQLRARLAEVGEEVR